MLVVCCLVWHRSWPKAEHLNPGGIPLGRYLPPSLVCCLFWQILAKAEHLNPGGSVKDRVALEILREALASGRLRAGGLVTEGTAGDPCQASKTCASFAPHSQAAPRHSCIVCS